MNSNDAKTRYNRVILKVNIFSKSSKKQPFSNLFKLIWNLSIDKKVVLMAASAYYRDYYVATNVLGDYCADEICYYGGASTSDSNAGGLWVTGIGVFALGPETDLSWSAR